MVFGTSSGAAGGLDISRFFLKKKSCCSWYVLSPREQLEPKIVPLD